MPGTSGVSGGVLTEGGLMVMDGLLRSRTTVGNPTGSAYQCFSLSRRQAVETEPFLQLRLPEPLVVQAVLDTEAKEQENGLNSSNPSRIALDRRPAELALQPQLGLCAQRSAHPGGSDRGDPGCHRPDLDS